MAEEQLRYSDLCRLCAAKTSLVMAIHIFESEGEMRQIGKKIEACLPVQVHEGDQLPKMICEDCIYKLELLSDFREKSAKTEKILIELFKELNCPRLQNQHTIMVDQNDLIMVQSHQLLADHTLPHIDLALNQRDTMMVEHEIILSHHNVDINSQSLDSIELSGPSLTNADLSNHTQDSIMVNPHESQDIQTRHFNEDNLTLMQQHQLLNEQLRLHHGLHVTLDEESASLPIPTEPLKSDMDQSESLLSGSSPPVKNGTEIFEETIRELPLPEQYNGNISAQVKLEEVAVIGSQNKQIFVPNGVHVVRMNNKDWYFCNLCDKAYEQRQEFDKHYESHFFKCQECLAVFFNMEMLNEHRKVHTSPLDTDEPLKDEKQQVKADCDTKKDADTLKPDTKEESNTAETAPEPTGEDEGGGGGKKKKQWTPKVCPTCGKSYKTNYKLQEHLRKHTGEKPYRCTSCDKAFRSKIGLTQHEAVHTGQYLYSCPTCGKGFQCKSYLMVHQRVHSDVKPYHCTTCGQDFKTKQALLDHTNRHLGVKPYICDICGRGFITKGLCKAHEKIHTGLDNRKYACKVCSKMFVSKSYLATHLRIHTGEKPHQCQVCDKGFVTRVDLRIHSTLHTGEKAFVCEICGKAFARRDALRCHRRSHTGERPYSCEICGQTFTQFTPMAIHKRLHTGERPYSCDTCGKAFVSRSTMLAHAKKHDR